MSSPTSNDLVMKLLKKKIGDFQSVIQSVSYVALYEFDKETEKWKKDNVEGPLYIYKKSDDSCGFVILNRRDEKDYQQRLDEIVETEMQSPYIFIKIQKDGKILVKGLWFYDMTAMLCVHGCLKEHCPKK